MHIEIRGVGLALTPAIRSYAHDQLTHALNQHRTHVAAVQVNLKDINGPRGGVDKEVDVTVRLARGAVFVVRALGADLYNAISAASERVKNTVGRQTAKLKRHR